MDVPGMPDGKRLPPSPSIKLWTSGQKKLTRPGIIRMSQLEYIESFVTWDEFDIPNWMESHKIPWFQTTN